MAGDRKTTYFRVQTAPRDEKSGIFQTRTSPSGVKVVSIRRETYMAAKKAAAKTMARMAQPV